MTIEFLVRPDDSPLRLNGSGMLLLNPPWQFDRVVGRPCRRCASTWANPVPAPA